MDPRCLLATALIASLTLTACGDPPVTGESAGIAPQGAIPGEISAGVSNAVFVPGGSVIVYRVETVPGEHVAFRLDFPAEPRGAVMTVMRWDGAHPVPLCETADGAGLRVLAVVDQDGPRTFWVRIDAPVDAVNGMLAVTRTPFTEGIHCARDCDRLLQLPLPNEPARDGYDISSAVARYQFGRRDLVMLVRAAGRSMAAAGYPAFRPWDLSDWEGRTPGVDVGEPRHASHERGRDADISLYGVLGQTPWWSHCVTRFVRGGRECIPGSFLPTFDGHRNAGLAGAFFASRRVKMFLDRELIAALVEGAERAVADGVVPGELLPLYSDDVHVRHWPDHDSHVHVRISEAAARRVREAR